MAKGSGTTKASSSRSPKGLGVGNIKIRTHEFGNLEAVGLQYSASTGLALNRIYGSVTAGGGSNFVSFPKGTKVSLVQRYSADAIALEKIYQSYRAELSKLSTTSQGDKKWDLLEAAEDKYLAQTNAYIEKRRKQLK